MELVHFYHRHRLHRLAHHPDFALFEFAIWLHTFARSLIAVFVPILLITTGYSIRDVIIYYLIFNIFDVPLNFLVDWLMRKVGARRILLSGTFATIAFFGLLAIMPAGNWPLLITLAFLAAAYDTLFWVSHIYMFIEANREVIDIGKTLGALEGIRKFASIAGPLAGAIILLAFGKIVLVVVSVALFVLSLIPLYKMKHLRDIPQEKKISFKQFFAHAREKRDYLAVALWGVHNETDETLWPLFIFTLFGTIGSVAIVPVIVSLTTAAFSYVAGNLTKRYATRMIVVGSIMIACIWIVRLTFTGDALYYGTIFLMGFFSLLVGIPLDSNVMARGLETDSLTASTYRNAASMALHIPLYAILALLVGVFRVSFGLAALSLFLLVAIIFLLRPREQKNKFA